MSIDRNRVRTITGEPPTSPISWPEQSRELYLGDVIELCHTFADLGIDVRPVTTRMEALEAAITRATDVDSGKGLREGVWDSEPAELHDRVQKAMWDFASRKANAQTIFDDYNRVLLADARTALATRADDAVAGMRKPFDKALKLVAAAAALGLSDATNTAELRRVNVAALVSGTRGCGAMVASVIPRPFRPLRPNQRAAGTLTLIPTGALMRGCLCDAGSFTKGRASVASSALLASLPRGRRVVRLPSASHTRGGQGGGGRRVYLIGEIEQRDRTVDPLTPRGGCPPPRCRDRTAGEGAAALAARIAPAGLLAPAPTLPAGRAWTKPEKARWRELWRSPQAVMWDDSARGTVAVLLVHEVAIMTGEASAWMAAEARHAADALGLTPRSMAAMGWTITE